MKTFGRRTISIVLSVIMVLSCFAGMTFSVGAETSGDYEYEVLDDGTLEITKYSGTDTEVDIPSEINGKEVTSIGMSDGYGVFWRCDATSVTIPSSIKKIGSTVFSQCGSLENIILSDGIEEISDYAFYELGISNIYIPSSVSNIGNSAFYNCKKLERIDVADNNENYKSSDGVLLNKDGTNLIFCPQGRTDGYVIPDGVTEIGKQAFYECTGLAGVTIPKSVIKIQDSAFEGCKTLTEINLSDSLTDIEGYAFSGCTSLSEINIPDSVANIGDSAFMYTALKKINIPGSIKNITQYAFCSCKSLEEIYISEGVESIECGAFKDTALNRKITIPRSVTQIDDDAMEYDTDKGDYDDGQINTAKTVIYGYKDTEAKRFAETKRFEFIDIDKPTENPTDKTSEVPSEPTTKADEKLEFADNSNINGRIDEENRKVSIVPSASAGMSLDDFKAMFKGAVSVAGEKIERVFNGMKFTFNGDEYTFIFKGDTSPDGKITAKDARTILRIAARLDSPDDVTKEAADVDSDGKATSKEARSVLRFAARLQNKLYE